MILLRDSLRGTSGFHIHFNSLVSRCPMKIIINERTIYLNELCFRNFSTWAVWYFLSFVEKRKSSNLKKDIYSWTNERATQQFIRIYLQDIYKLSDKNETKQSKKKEKTRTYKCTVKTICSLKHISSPTSFRFMISQ